METIGFVGLGIMGAPMAGHLLDAGYTVLASDHRGPPPKLLLDKGLKTVSGLDAVPRRTPGQTFKTQHARPRAKSGPRR